MKLSLFNMFIPPLMYEDPVIQKLLAKRSVIGIQQSEGGTIKLYSTDRASKDTDVSGVYALEVKDKHSNNHYLMISVLDLIGEEKYKGCAQAYLFSVMANINSKYVSKVDADDVDINDSVFKSIVDAYEGRIIEVNKYS